MDIEALTRLIVEVIEEKITDNQHACLMLGAGQQMGGRLKEYYIMELSNYRIEYYNEFQYEKVEELLNYESIILYNPSLKLLSSIRHILLDSKVVEQLFKALKNNNEVKIIFSDQNTYMKGYAKPLQKEIDGLLKQIQAFGIQIIEMKNNMCNKPNAKENQEQKKLLTLEDVIELVKSNSPICLKGDILCTPLAMDYIREKKIKLIS